MSIAIEGGRILILRLICFVGACILTVLPLVSYAQDFSHAETQAAPSAAMVQQANDALASGDIQGALKVLKKLNAQTPNNAQILYDLGMTLDALGPEAAVAGDAKSAEPGAESYYRSSIAADASFAPPRVALGLLLARTDRAVEARTELLAATSLPGVDPALEGRAYRALARLELAAAEADGGAAGVGSQLSNLAGLTAASSDLLAALKVTAEEPEDILLAAEIARASKDLAGAERTYRRYLALPGEEGDTQAIAALGGVLTAEGHLDEAESLLTPALARDPGNPAFAALLAQAWLKSEDAAKIAQAAPLVESLHAKAPTNAAITRLLARIYLETGHPDQAEPLYAALIAAQPSHPDATLLDDRGEALIRLHRPGEAEKVLKQAVADRNGFATPAVFGDAALHLAFAAEEIDDPVTTLQAIALRDAVQTPSASSLFLAATANDDLHHRTQAVELYRQFLTVAHGTLPEQESQARRRVAELGRTK